MLIADSVALEGRHATLLEPTSLKAAQGSVLIVAAPTQDTRTALSLILTGRMKPDAGTVAWEGTPDRRTLRRASTLVDSPAINEPEQHLRVRDLVAEDLALLPGPFWRHRSSDAWLDAHGLEHLAREWVDAVEPVTRLRLLAALGLEDARSRLLVFDSPERHGLSGDAWATVLRDIAGGRRHPAVVAVASRIPADWTGATAAAGGDHLPRGTSPDGETPWEADPLPTTSEVHA
ncbi:ABC transporter ATP-binding protein [Zafaria sp. Z1313]|uniref:ABC transporter ATP-binding protein n=1 Tax=unclassified Zafaria TaxID=2828765 RepID=UPI002E784133|nr:ABC transporter ATP-binding protein [Zafaria sp. J156]MEE1622063.1 ABC transporter ATP-binding protein [Zafaria sp. J156]